MPSLLQEILDSPKLSRIRRNHGLEHATIHLLTARYPHALLVGRSDMQGFFLFGDVPTEAVQQAATEALARLSAGEHRLALHPNCGTSLVTAGALAGGAAFLIALGPRDERLRDRWARLPFAILAATLGVIVAQPLGLAIQRHLTTEASPGSLGLLAVRRLRPGTAVVHRVITGD